MYNQEKFIKTLQKMQGERSLNKFSEDIQLDSGYLSRIFTYNKKTPPTPTTLKKIANNSKGFITYTELMMICGHIENDIEGISDETFSDYLEKMNVLNKEESKIVEKIFTQNNDLKNISVEKMHNSFRKLIDNSNLSNESKIKITEAFISFSELMKERVKYRMSKIITPMQIPVIGKISAGQPLLAEENFQGYEFAPSTIIKEGYDYFYLKVIGDSMNTKFNDGDLVLVQKQEDLENGEIGVIRVNGYDATVKRFKRQNEFIILEPMSANPEHCVQIYNPKDTEIRIIGKVVSYMGKI